ncbi:MAG: GDP-mannose 4,6-dehydratase [Candidatus Babeliaceae bacterium]|jgi:dTDP-glucose 4,6-dehydratase
MLKQFTVKSILLLILFFCITALHTNEKTVFLTGAAGFIGSNFLQYMFDKYPSYNFLVLDSLTYAGSLDNIPEVIRESPRFSFFHGSVTDKQLVDTLMPQAHFVVHFAAETHVARSIYDSSNFFETDILGTKVLLDSLIQHKNVERFIHISTSEVCGSAKTTPMDEEHPINPQSPYAAAKAGADRLVYAYQCTYDIPTVIIRPFNNYGPQQHLEKMIPRFIHSAMCGLPLTIHGDGCQTRDWLYVTDTCRALDKILHHGDFNTIKNQIIHIGTGEETSVLAIAQCILGMFDVPESQIAFITDRPGQVDCHISSTKKSRDLLDWQPTVSLEEGLRSTVQWYKNNPEWCSKRESMKLVPIFTKQNIIEMH